MHKKKLGIISSCGGHLTEIRMLISVYSKYEYFYVLNDNAILPEDMQNKTYFITHSERDWKFFINLWEAFKIIKKEKPKILISTGAGLIIPFAIISRFFRIKTIYIETLASAEKPTLTGRIMYYLSDIFYYQWPHLNKFFPRGECIGTLL